MIAGRPAESAPRSATAALTKSASDDARAPRGQQQGRSTAGCRRSESEAHSIVVVFDGLAADELPSRQEAQDPAEAQALALVGSLRDEPAALLPAMRALLALSAASERGQLPADQRITLEIEPW